MLERGEEGEGLRLWWEDSRMDCRSMYVRAVVLDGYGKKMEGDIFSPSHSFVIGANVKQVR